MTKPKSRFSESMKFSPKRNSSGEPEVVYSKVISPVLRKWIEHWEVDHPVHIQEGGRWTNYHFGPMVWLEQETKINRRRISAILSGEIQRVPLTQADKLLTAIGKSHMLGREILVHKNPVWTLEKYQAYMEERGCF